MDPHRAVALLYERQAARGGWRRVAQRVRDAAEGRLVVPMPELDDAERPAVANLIVQGIDQLGSRIASVPSQTRFFPTKPGMKGAERAARDRAAAFKGLKVANAYSIIQRRRARWFVAYGSAPVIVRPVNGGIVWEPRDPLTCFPSPSADPDAMMSEDCVLSITRPWWWVQQNYPQAASMLRRPKNLASSETVTLVEYVNSETWGLYAAAPGGDPDRFIERVHGEAYGATPGISRSGPGTSIPPSPADQWEGTEHAVTLVETPNRSGLCPVVVPQRICLGQVTGQFDQMVDIYIQQAKLMALELNAVTESVFPPLWAVQRENEQLEIVTVADGKRGRVGEVRGGTLQPIQLNPGFQTYPTIDRLERIQRLNGGIPQDFSGENSTGTRTGRRGELLLSAVIDFPTQEAQESFARSEWHENICAIAVGRGHYRSKQFSFGAAWRGRGPKTFTFGDLFPDADSTSHDVRYSYAGADSNGMLIRQGQKMGLGMLSKQSAMEDDPEIDDPELEKDRIQAEALEEAFLSSIQQQAASGAIDPGAVARMMQLVRTDREELADAYLRAQAEAQEAAAQTAPAGAPETQPGLSPMAPTASPEGGLLPDVSAMTQALGALRLGQRSSPQEQQAERVAAVGA